jgi:hypothetical protein
MTSAAQARDEAMAQVDAGADEKWKEGVILVIEEICRVLGFGKTFTTDQVWEGMELVFPEVTTHEPRAMGPMMAKAAKMGLITKTDRVVDSERVECHARPVAVWKVTTFSKK